MKTQLHSTHIYLFYLIYFSCLFLLTHKHDSNSLCLIITEELSGIFVKSISEGSAADLCKKIQVNDRIVEVDGRSLQGYTNHQAVEVIVYFSKKI